jgi:hypothetical protein
VSDFEGSASVEADQPILALAANTTADKKAREIYTGLGTATKLSFPIYRHLGSVAQSSIISLQNPSDSMPVKATLRYFDENGVRQGILSHVLPPLARYDFDSNTLFGGSSVTYAVRVDADGAIVGSEQIRFLSDTAAVEGLIGSNSGIRYFVSPVQRTTNATGKLLAWSEIFVQNAGKQPINVTATFYNPKGVSQAEISKTIPASGFSVFDSSKVLTKNFNGYAVIKGSDLLAVQALAMRSEGRRMAGYSAINVGNAGATWACTDIRRIVKPAQSNQLQVLNIGKVAEDVQVEVFAPATGLSLSKKSYTVKPNRLITIMLDKPTQPAGAAYSALVLIRGNTTAKLIATAINQFAGGGDADFSCQRLVS